MSSFFCNEANDRGRQSQLSISTNILHNFCIPAFSSAAGRKLCASLAWGCRKLCRAIHSCRAMPYWFQEFLEDCNSCSIILPLHRKNGTITTDQAGLYGSLSHDKITSPVGSAFWGLLGAEPEWERIPALSLGSRLHLLKSLLLSCRNGRASSVCSRTDLMTSDDWDEYGGWQWHIHPRSKVESLWETARSCVHIQYRDWYRYTHFRTLRTLSSLTLSCQFFLRWTQSAAASDSSSIFVVENGCELGRT